jgi:hypothetical protein
MINIINIRFRLKNKFIKNLKKYIYLKKKKISILLILKCLEMKF